MVSYPWQGEPASSPYVVWLWVTMRARVATREGVLLPASPGSEGVSSAAPGPDVEKSCSKCGISKPMGQFYKGSGRDGRHTWCAACCRANDAERRKRRYRTCTYCREELPDRKFYLNASIRAGKRVRYRSHVCKDCAQLKASLYALPVDERRSPARNASSTYGTINVDEMRAERPYVEMMRLCESFEQRARNVGIITGLRLYGGPAPEVTGPDADGTSTEAPDNSGRATRW